MAAVSLRFLLHMCNRSGLTLLTRCTDQDLTPVSVCIQTEGDTVRVDAAGDELAFEKAAAAEAAAA